MGQWVGERVGLVTSIASTLLAGSLFRLRHSAGVARDRTR